MQAAIEVVRDFLTQGTAAGVRLGDPKTSWGLTLIPVFHEGPVSEYVLLTEAMASGLVRIAEVDAEGDVPALLVENRAPQPLLLVQGEIFAGMKQNRVINATVWWRPTALWRFRCPASRSAAGARKPPKPAGMSSTCRPGFEPR